MSQTTPRNSHYMKSMVETVSGSNSKGIPPIPTMNFGLSHSYFLRMLLRTVQHNSIPVSSHTTATSCVLLTALLSPFNTTLRTHSTSTIGRRLFEEDFPLQMVLEGSCVHRNSKLVLRDNTYSTIQWDAFTQPELHNFIQILQREEEIYADKVDMVSVTPLLWVGVAFGGDI